MRPRFRKRHGGDSGDLDAPESESELDFEVEEAEETGGRPSFDDLLAERLAESADAVEPSVPETVEPAIPEIAETTIPEIAELAVVDAPVHNPPAEDVAPRPAPPGRFWDHFDRAAAEAELAAIPPASVIAVVGPIEASAPVVANCREHHWMRSACDVFVLTKRRRLPEFPSWTIVDQPSDLVAVLDDGRSDFPILVIDVPADLPAFVRPLVKRLRDGGVGLVHYVLDGDPDDEDLATWYGEIGQPSVLDLASPVAPARVLDLFDRGDPVVSVAGRPLTAELLLAFRADT